MKVIDMRFNTGIIQSWVGKIFVKYKCDAFNFTNSVTQIVGLYIDDEVYSLTNIQEAIDYYGFIEDMSVSKITRVEDSAIKSAFKNVEMISTPVGEKITSVKIVNEQQTMAINGEPAYEVWLTRAIIFEVGGREISFEKDTVPFSEEITIQRGYDLIDKISDNDDFLKEWDEEYTPSYKREVIYII
ncbi:MAG: hypothetical protein IKO61_10280 [Lachnospiraceae bacterium]|nr:hypothetical protein [Lachnospiraceae bacterium]